MAFVNFMRSPAGRFARIAAGIAIVLVGLLVIGGTGGIIVALVGLVPIAAGAGNFCLAGPLMGTDLQGNPKGGAG
jgi:hypothetical protein